MARSEGALGRALASGSRRLAERYGHPEAAMAVKGMEIPAYDPRVTWTQAMSYMTAARGGCHLQGGYSAPIAFCAGYGEFPGIKSEGAALIARNFAYQNTAYDVLGVCAFAGFSVTLDEYANMLNDVTGLEMKASDLEMVSRRVLTLERAVQSAVRLHDRGRLAARALLHGADSHRGGDGCLSRGRVPRDARRVLRVARLGRARRAARRRDPRPGARRAPRPGEFERMAGVARLRPRRAATGRPEQAT